MATTTLDALELLEFEPALPCEFTACASEHGDPAAWLISVRHAASTCSTERVVVCAPCVEQLQERGDAPCYCRACSQLLPYRVREWWVRLRPVR